MKTSNVLVVVFVTVLGCATASNRTKDDGKVFSLFNIVRFKNEVCLSNMFATGSSAANRNGTCLTAEECSGAGGTASGNCASGFGICCVFLKEDCGSSIGRNCSYIRNPNSPSAYTSSSSCQYTITKCATGVCYLRLDFDTFVIAALTSTSEDAGNGQGPTATALPPNPCLDTFTVTGTNTGQVVPVICGTNSGQHIYIDIGSSAQASAGIAFAFTNTGSRYWDIKITQIECTNPSSPPDGCLQYHLDIDGQLRTFNFDDSTTGQHLPSQQYSICVRRAEGMCCIEYTACSQYTNSFKISVKTAVLTAGTPAVGIAQLDSECAQDFISIEGASHNGQVGSVMRTRFCGEIFSLMTASPISEPVISCATPFKVGIRTDSLADNDGATPPVKLDPMTIQRGVCLEYVQLPCTQ